MMKKVTVNASERSNKKIQNSDNQMIFSWISKRSVIFSCMIPHITLFVVFYDYTLIENSAVQCCIAAH